MKTTTPEQKKTISRYMAALRREQRKPEARVFPKWHPRMSTFDYIERYNVLNRGQYRQKITLDFDVNSLSLEPAQYDPMIPLRLEEVTND